MYNQAALILAEGCNLKCPFCFEGEHLDGRLMSEETFDKVIDKIIEEKIEKIVLFGGEPLLNLTPKMRERLLKEKDKFHVSIYTNGILLTDEIIDFFKQLPKFKINISCHVPASIKGAEKVAKRCNPHEYCLFVVCDEKTFDRQFSMVEPLIKQYSSFFALQTLVPDFDYSYESTSPIYDRLVPYKDRIQEFFLFNPEEGYNLDDGLDQMTEIIFTYDGKISLTKSVNLQEDDIWYPLETPISDIIGSSENPNNDPIEIFPWQCETCPVNKVKLLNCPYQRPFNHDFSLCRRSILLYSIIKEEKELLCDAIMGDAPMSTSYDKFTNKVESVMLNVTDQCNFRCRMCFCNWEEHYMTPEIADKAIELALSLKSPKRDKLVINFFGGEPLMNIPLIKYVIEKWKDKCGFTMTTNGSLLTEELLKYFKKNDVGILLSIDGDKETQDFNRPFKSGEGSTFDVLAPKIPKILEFYPTVTFRSTIIPQTVHLLHHNYQFAKKMGFKNYFCTPDAYSDWTGYENELMKQTSLITMDIIQDIYEGNEILVPRFVMDGIVDYLRLQDGLTSPSVSPFRCGMGIYGFGVGATGIIAACQEHSTITDNSEDIFIIGDIENGISQEKHMKLLNKFYHDKNQWLMTECKDCPLREVCINHVCPSRQFFMFKNFAEHAQADCLWTKCSHLSGQMIFQFFSQNFSANFESFLEHILKNNDLELKKEVKYEI